MRHSAKFKLRGKRGLPSPLMQPYQNTRRPALFISRTVANDDQDEAPILLATRTWILRDTRCLLMGGPRVKQNSSMACIRVTSSPRPSTHSSIMIRTTRKALAIHRLSQGRSYHVHNQLVSVFKASAADLGVFAFEIACTRSTAPDTSSPRLSKHPGRARWALGLK